VSVVLGYALLSKYPVNIIRLRRYMEDIVNGRLPDKVRLVESMDDIGAIERSMNLIIEQLSGRLTEMESEIERRQRAERLKDDFVSTVSHELRTPLAIAKEGISLLLDGIPGQINEKQGKVLTATRGNIDRLARLINDLLDISKIEAGKMQLRRGRMDMARLAAQAAASLRPRRAPSMPSRTKTESCRC
jgi:signal transduction histidine kinase